MAIPPHMNPYNTVIDDSPHMNPYGDEAVSKELNLRAELHRTFFGAVDETAKGRIGFLRRMRRDEDGKLIRCTCRDHVTDEPDKDYYCRYCLGMGWLWDERKLIYYKDDDSSRRFNYTVFYLEYSVLPTKEDYIVELKRDAEGNPVLPIQRERYWKVVGFNTIEEFRGDNGRIEYWRIRAMEDYKWGLDYGVQPRIPGAASSE